MKSIKFLMSIVMTMMMSSTFACAIIYYVDTTTGNIYIANNEDYYFDVKTYIQIEPANENELARAWYGWDDFAQGGVNEAGLFFDGAVIPSQGLKFERPKKFKNLGDYILTKYKTVEEAIHFIKENNIQLDGAQMMLGDATGNAVIASWKDGVLSTTYIKDNSLVATNFNVAYPDLGNYPCYRHTDISKRIEALNLKEDEITFRDAGNLIGGAAQMPAKDKDGRTGGTLYTSFIDITNMKLYVVYQLDNSKLTKLDLKSEFDKGKRKKIRLK